MLTTSPEKLSWRFPTAFWIGNVSELFERAAFYSMFIVLTVYLTKEVGFSDVQTGYVTAWFSSSIYFFPPIAGALADKIGFRIALMLAFALLSLGYFLLGAIPTKAASLVSLALVIAGGSFIKPVITGTAVKCSDQYHRARALSIFYWMVNIGSFSGKTIAAPLREHYSLFHINYFAAATAFVAFVWVALFFRPAVDFGNKRAVADVIRGLGRVLKNGRFMALILIVAGFWIIQGQLYAAMPKYILRLLGDSAKPEWLANVNPLVVVLCVVPITHLVRRRKPESAIGIGLLIIPFSALAMALSPALESAVGNSIKITNTLALHPITLMVIIGIAVQGFAECFLSPKFLEYASRQAPPGEEGLYMGYQNLTVFVAWAVGFALSGHLIDRYCPDPAKLPSEAFAQWEAAIKTGSQLPVQCAHAHYIWYIYAAIGAAAFIALCIFRAYTKRVDMRKAAVPG